jgi:large subunit ribosomal protein L14
MIQTGSYLNIVDNSGAKKAYCIKILNSGYRQRYASIGSVILVSIKSVRFSKTIKVKRGGLHKAVLLKTRNKIYSYSFNYKKYYENSAVLIHNKQNKLLGTRIFSFIPKYFKYTKFLKLITLSFGISC